MFRINIIALVALVALVKSIDGAAIFCTEPPCEMNLGYPCAKAIGNVYGTCCSLADSGTDDCTLTVTGENVECNFRDPQIQVQR